MTLSINNFVTAQAAALPPGAWCWVPIRSLAAHHRPAIQAHLLGLDEADRYLRFGRVANDAQITDYVEKIDFDLDEVYGVFNRKLELIAMAHLAHLRQTDAQPRLAEFGVSVSKSARGRGAGKQLFDLAVLRARNRGVDTLVTHALAGNAAMLHIVRSAGATIESDGHDATALLHLPPQDLVSHLGAMAQEHVAELDFNVKRHAHFFGGLLRLKAADLPDA
jgi:RimJ/RimL family protein N-acetyltransferase